MDLLKRIASKLNCRVIWLSPNTVTKVKKTSEIADYKEWTRTLWVALSWTESSKPQISKSFCDIV
jgi:hypothetical protein